MDDYKYIQLIVSPDALRSIKTILITKKIGSGMDELDNQWAKVLDAINDRKNSVTIETKRDKDNGNNN